MTLVTFRRPYKIGATTYAKGDNLDVTDRDLLETLLVSQIVHHKYDVPVKAPSSQPLKGADREVPGGVAGLGPDGKLFEERLPGRLSPESIADALAAAVKPATKRVTMALTNPTSGSPAGVSSGWIERHMIRLPVKTTRWRLKVANRDVKNNAACTAALKLHSAHWAPIGSIAATRWAGTFASAQQPVYTASGDIPTNATDLVTPWVTDAAKQFGPDAAGLQYVFTVAQAAGTFAASSSPHGFIRIDGLGTLTTPSGSGYAGNNGILDVRLEYEFVGANPVGLYIGASNDEGFTAGDYTSNPCATWEAWPGALGMRAGIPWVNAGIGGAREASFTDPSKAAIARFDLATTVPDFAVVNLAGNSMLAVTTAGQSNQIISDVAWVINNTLRPLGIKRIFLATMQPAGWASNDVKEVERQAYNAWVRQMPVGVAGVLDFDLILRNPLLPLNVRPEYVLADALHLRRVGQQWLAGSVNIAL